jgi:hypothetical protein
MMKLHAYKSLRDKELKCVKRLGGREWKWIESEKVCKEGKKRINGQC